MTYCTSISLSTEYDKQKMDLLDICYELKCAILMRVQKPGDRNIHVGLSTVPNIRPVQLLDRIWENQIDISK